MALICLFLSIFLSFLYYMLTLKVCVAVFSGTFKARMLKLGIHMDNELLYCGIENQTPCLSICLSFLDKFMSHFLRN